MEEPSSSLPYLRCLRARRQACGRVLCFPGLVVQAEEGREGVPRFDRDDLVAEHAQVVEERPGELVALLGLGDGPRRLHVA
jgi:hypothetical protein